MILFKTQLHLVIDLLVPTILSTANIILTSNMTIQKSKVVFVRGDNFCRRLFSGKYSL